MSKKRKVKNKKKIKIMSEIYQLPDSSGNNGNATIPFSIPIGFGGYGNGGMFGNGNGFSFPSSSQLPKPNIESEELHDAN